ncbi:winged helix-turn-helix transcriptional regulator [Methylophilus flavus]|uniref:Winged helix-turn-helix transcriptional regulator n=2 Tax=Methylophilus flavus TaxID=640084 RepID=A0ABW3P837_9PROT
MMSKDTDNVLQISSSWDAYQTECPTRLVLNRIADKWAVLVLGLLESETKRFSALQREIGGISQKMLTQTLRGLERDGLIARTIYPTVPPKVEYTITPLGKTLVGLLAALRVWSETHIEEVQQAQSNYDKTEQTFNAETVNGVRTVRF